MGPSVGQLHHAVLNIGSGSGVPNHWWFNQPIILLHDHSADQCLGSILQPFGREAEMLTNAPIRCCCQCQILTLIHPNCQGRDIHYISRTSYARFRVRMKRKLIFLAISLAFLLNIRVEVMVTLHGESTSHRWWNLPLDNRTMQS